MTTPISTATPRYRADIDGLRAVAVLSVVLFHLAIPPFAGGFVGVDIFFVISGFLITGIIAGDLARGDFSIARFYVRRVRRIFPALYLTLALTLAAAALMLAPYEMQPLLASLAHLAVFGSNFYFMRAGGYFDAPLEANPVLQTWSLSVEEQFYVLFPPLLWLLHRYARAHLGRAVVGLAVLFLALSIARVGFDARKAFFATDVRVFELLTGAIVALRVLPALESHRHRTLAALAGVALMAASVLLMSAATPFPGLAAVPVCLGTALVIWSGERGTLVSRALAWRPLVGVGLVSYSVYLLHWPIIVLTRRFLGGELMPTHKAVLLALSLAAGYLSWRFVEQPFRHPAPRERSTPVLAAAVALIAVLGLGSLAAERALPSPPVEVLAQADAARKEATSDPCFLHDDIGPERWESATCHLPATGPLVAVWGDSYAAHYFAALRDWASQSRAGLMILGADSCPPIAGLPMPDRPQCPRFNAMAMERLAQARPAAVILSGHWLRHERRRALAGDDIETRLRETVRTLSAGGAAVIVVGPSPVFANKVPHYALATDGPALHGRFYARHSRYFDHVFQAMAQAGEIAYLPAHEVFCGADELCRFRDEAGYLFWDEGHMTRAGARLVIERLTRTVLPDALTRRAGDRPRAPNP